MTTQCAAMKIKGGQCVRNAYNGMGMCTQHLNMHNRAPVAAPPVMVPIVGLNVVRRRRQQLDILAFARRTRILEENARDLDDSANASANRMLRIAQKAMTLWLSDTTEGWGIPKAYACIRYKSPRADGFPALIRSVLKYVHLDSNNPDNHLFSNVPLAIKTAAVAEITVALVAYGEINEFELIPVSDINLANMNARKLRDEARAQAAEAARIERERQEQLERDFRERPVIFQRDPEGSINLAAFGTDRQNIHRSSVQTSTERSINTLLSRQLQPDQDALPELIAEFMTSTHIRWRNRTDRTPAGSIAIRDSIINTLTNDYFNLEAFSVGYGTVVDHVWSFVSRHENREDLILRFAQELAEGLGMCSNGKMAHLINILQGYDDTLEVPVDNKELFRNAIAKLMDTVHTEREAAARLLFAEYNIPAEEHVVWLEPLLEV